MSLFDDLGAMGLTTEGSDPWGFGSTVGAQSDGTYNTPVTAIQAQPVDAGGGGLGQYSAQILDVFKFGVGTWAQSNATDKLLDYKRFEATNGGLYQQGNAAGIRVGSGGATIGVSSGMVMLIAGALALLLLTGKRG